MTEVLTCSQCSATVPPDAPGGVCPYCVLQLAGSEGSGTNPTAAFSNAPTLPTLTELATLFPQLEILELVGRGGMGAVYKARQPNLDRSVALKILLPDISKDPTFAECFSREARALARLNHPHIVSVYDSGHVGGLYFFIMEYVDGVNLRQAIQAEQISPEKALAIVPQICEALQYAHEEGVVHRDIKPENVLLDRKGRVKVADFGLAKLLGLATPDITLTGTRQAMGTLHYMAPEQYEKPQSVDHRADIYSLGVVFYELLTGKLPLGRFALPSEKVRVDVRLDDVVLKSLEREPERRYQYVSEVKTEMDSIAHSPAPQRPHETVFAAGRGMHAPPPRAGREEVFSRPPPAPPQETSDFGRAALILGIVAILAMPLLCGGGALLSYFLGTGGPAWLGILVLMPLLVIGGVVLVIVGLASKRPASVDPAPADKTVPQAALREAAHSAVRWPALAMFLLALVAWVPVLVVAVAGELDDALRDDDFPGFFLLLVQVVSSVVMIAASMRMRQLQGYSLAMTAAIMALLPTYLVWPLGIPVGIWALVVLSQRDVREAFGIVQLSPQTSGAQRAMPVAVIVLAILAGIVVLPVLAIGLFFTRATVSRAPQVSSAVYDYSGQTTAVETPRPAAPKVIQWTKDGPVLGELAPFGIHLDPEKTQVIQAALTDVYADYLKIEKEHTRRTINDLGHQVVTVSPFPKELTRLEDSFWTKVDEVVTDDSSRGALRDQLNLGTLFPFGQTDYSIEIWKVGTWYSYVNNPRFGTGQPSKVSELPADIKRFWQPTPDKEPMTNDQ